MCSMGGSVFDGVDGGGWVFGDGGGGSVTRLKV